MVVETIESAVIADLQEDRSRMIEGVKLGGLLAAEGLSVAKMGSMLERIDEYPLVGRVGRLARFGGAAMVGLGVVATGISLVSISSIQERIKDYKSGKREHFEP